MTAIIRMRRKKKAKLSMIKVERLHTAAQVTLPFCPLSYRERKRRRLGERREGREYSEELVSLPIH